MNFYVYLIILFSLNQTFSYNILGIFPHIGKSHADVFKPLMKALAEKGHKVTVLSHFPLIKTIPNYKDLKLGTKQFSEVFDIKNIDPSSKLQKLGDPMFLATIANTSCEEGLGSDAVKMFMKTKIRYHVMIMEFFNSDCFMGLSQRVQAPIIGITSSTMMPWISKRLANPTHTAYIPNNSMNYSDRMTFFERLENTLVTLFHQFYYEYIVLRRDEAIATKHLGRKAGKVREFIKNTSLVLTNTHFSLNLPKPLVPNVIEVGGLHIRKQRPLSKNIEKWINESKEGVIYFSLGSLIKGHTFPKDKRNAFLKAFSRLPQRVLWKWENETMEGKPDNVMIQKWMPQLDILCHPNVKAFISHGGLLGMTEAVHCGVPVIVMPQFGDQHTNARALEASGGGVILQLSEATEDKVYKVLKKVLSADFNKQAKELSERFRDRPLPPMETAIYWVEYVARHKGAYHMRTAAVNMPFYQYYLLDVAAFLIFVISLFIYLSYRLTKYVLSKLFKAKNTKQKIS